MSATPRPWWAKTNDRIESREGEGGVPIYATLPDGTCPRVANVRMVMRPGPHDEANAELIVTAVNAFDALLAVAEAADRKHLRLSDGTSLGFASRRRDDPIVQALEALDAAHPGWRTWTA